MILRFHYTDKIYFITPASSYQGIVSSIQLLLEEYYFIIPASIYNPTTPPRGLGGVVELTLPMARADRGSRPVYYLPSSDLGQVVNLSVRLLAVNLTTVKPA